VKEVIIYTDGACRGNPGPGGYGVVLMAGANRKTLAGGYRHTTNNRMEMQATIVALEALKFPCKVQLCTDSKYICDAINKQWIVKWKQKNWTRGKNEKVKNSDLWKELEALLEVHEVQFIWVKGHSDNEYNNEADALAVAASKDTTTFEVDVEFEKTAGLNFG